VGIDVAGIGHQGRVNELIDRGTVRLAPRRRRKRIAGETPAGVKGHAEAVHGPAPEQRFKAELRGDHIHRLRVLQQGSGVAAIGTEIDARVAQIDRAEIAPFAARRHIGMGLEQHAAVGIVV